MKNKTKLILTILIFSGCLKSIKYATNPISGKAFTVNFQAEDVQVRFHNGDMVGYAGSCEITSKADKVLTIIDLRNTDGVSSQKSSLTAGVILAAGQKTKIRQCFFHPVEGSSVFQIVYKDGEKILTDDIPVSFSR